VEKQQRLDDAVSLTCVCPRCDSRSAFRCPRCAYSRQVATGGEGRVIPGRPRKIIGECRACIYYAWPPRRFICAALRAADRKQATGCGRGNCTFAGCVLLRTQRSAFPRTPAMPKHPARSVRGGSCGKQRLMIGERAQLRFAQNFPALSRSVLLLFREIIALRVYDRLVDARAQINLINSRLPTCQHRRLRLRPLSGNAREGGGGRGGNRVDR